ncbi:MAG: hypothetical protein WA913_12135, partial [Pricia sp.]
MKKLLVLFFGCIWLNLFAVETKKIPITVENNSEGAPITLGIPFPIGELSSVDNIRLINSRGKEILCQTTEVSTWEPIGESVKWIWVFFFTEKEAEYTLEYGENVVPMRAEENIVSINNMRPGGGIFVNTGPLSLTISKSGDGFLDKVMLDSNNNGTFEEDEL